MRDELFLLITRAGELESRAMKIYVRLARNFDNQSELGRFWNSMARHEAAHVGALQLLEAMLVEADDIPSVRISSEALAHADETMTQVEAQLDGNISAKKAFELAIDLESSELEDLILDLISSMNDSVARDQAKQMLVHDLSDLSLMVEKYANDDALLARVDALVEHHMHRDDTAA